MRTGKRLCYLKLYCFTFEKEKNENMKSIFLVLILSFTSAFSSYGQLQVSYNSDANQIANYLLGSGVNIANATITGDSLSSGLFLGGSTTSLSMNEGLVLSNGDIGIIPGPNNLQGASGYMAPNGLGDADLDSILIGSFSQTYDASAFEFEVESMVSTFDTIAFNFIFGSEEYPEWVNSGFNDIFAFLVSGPNPAGGNYVKENIALVPGTSDVVSVNTINENVNASYYVDNGDGNSSPCDTSISCIQYDGFTVPLEAKFAVIPNQTYQLKLVIADVSDSIIDSGVFIEAGSIYAKGNAVDPTSVFEIDSQSFISDMDNEWISIETKDKALISIFSLSGQLIVSYNLDANSMETIALTDLDRGLYLINYATSGEQEAYKFFKK